MILRPCPVGAASLTWVPESRMYVTEASDLPANLGRVYDDACDEGLTLISRWDGRECVFVVNHVELDRDENEIKYWDLIPANRDKRWHGLKIRIFND